MKSAYSRFHPEQMSQSQISSKRSSSQSSMRQVKQISPVNKSMKADKIKPVLNTKQQNPYNNFMEGPANSLNRFKPKVFSSKQSISIETEYRNHKFGSLDVVPKTVLQSLKREIPIILEKPTQIYGDSIQKKNSKFIRDHIQGVDSINKKSRNKMDPQNQNKDLEFQTLQVPKQRLQETKEISVSNTEVGGESEEIKICEQKDSQCSPPIKLEQSQMFITQGEKSGEKIDIKEAIPKKIDQKEVLQITHKTQTLIGAKPIDSPMKSEEKSPDKNQSDFLGQRSQDSNLFKADKFDNPIIHSFELNKGKKMMIPNQPDIDEEQKDENLIEKLENQRDVFKSLLEQDPISKEDLKEIQLPSREEKNTKQSQEPNKDIEPDQKSKYMDYLKEQNNKQLQKSDSQQTVVIQNQINKLNIIQPTKSGKSSSDSSSKSSSKSQSESSSFESMKSDDTPGQSDKEEQKKPSARKSQFLFRNKTKVKNFQPKLSMFQDPSQNQEIPSFIQKAILKDSKAQQQTKSAQELRESFKNSQNKTCAECDLPHTTTQHSSHHILTDDLMLGAQIQNEKNKILKQRRKSVEQTSVKLSTEQTPQVRRSFLKRTFTQDVSKILSDQNQNQDKKINDQELKGSSQKRNTIALLKSFLAKRRKKIIKKQTIRQQTIIKKKSRALQDDLDALEKDAFCKQERIDYLWGRVRSHFRSTTLAGRLIKQIQLKSKKSVINASRGEASANLLRANTSMGIDSEDKWLCLVNIDSNFHRFWETFIYIATVYFSIIIPCSVATRNLYMDPSGLEKIFSFGLILDIPYSCVVQQIIQETMNTKYISESLKFYVIGYRFIFDLFSLQLFVFKIFSPDHVKFQMAIELLLKAFLKDSHDHKDFSIQVQNFNKILENVKHDHESQLEYFLENYIYSARWLVISKVLFYLRFSYIQRYIRVNRSYKELFETVVTDMTLKPKILIILQFIQLVIQMVIVIWLVSCIWMFFSNYYVELLFELVNDHLDKDLALTDGFKFSNFDLNLNQFYLFGLTMTVIGYGDEVSMPNLENHKDDYQWQLLCMMFGMFAFQQIQAQLTSFMEDMNSESQTVAQTIIDLQDQLEKYFINHNTTNGVKQLSQKYIERAKRVLVSNYTFGYKNIGKTDIFNNLPEQVKQKIFSNLIRNEVIFFSNIFKNEANEVQHKTVFKILSNIESELCEPNTIIVNRRDQFNHFFMVKKGEVRCFNKQYDYLYSLEEGQFCGEFNIMFGLCSEIYYKSSSQAEICLFKIDQDKFMNCLCEDIHAFRHFHSLALQKFRFNQVYMRRFREIVASRKWRERYIFGTPPKENENPFMDNQEKEVQTISLFDVLQIMGHFFSQNIEVAQFYEEISEQKENDLREQIVNNQNKGVLKKRYNTIMNDKSKSLVRTSLVGGFVQRKSRFFNPLSFSQQIQDAQSQAAQEDADNKQNGSQSISSFSSCSSSSDRCDENHSDEDQDLRDEQTLDSLFLDDYSHPISMDDQVPVDQICIFKKQPKDQTPNHVFQENKQNFLNVLEIEQKMINHNLAFQANVKPSLVVLKNINTELIQKVISSRDIKVKKLQAKTVEKGIQKAMEIQQQDKVQENIQSKLKQLFKTQPTIQEEDQSQTCDSKS